MDAWNARIPKNVLFWDIMKELGQICMVVAMFVSLLFMSVIFM